MTGAGGWGRRLWQAGGTAAGLAGEFEEQRARLFGLTYRLLGSAADAEDVVQDTYVGWSGVDQAAIVVPPVWLARVATNLCLNRLASARVHREVYIGSWLPEPVLTSDGTLGPMDSAAQRDSGDQITAVRLMSNPDKLGFASRQAARLSRLSPVTGH